MAARIECRSLWRELQQSTVEQWRQVGLEKVNHVIRGLVQESLEEKNRLAVTEENIALLHSLVSPLPPTPLLPSHLDLLTNCFKLMRNLSAGVSENQKRIVDSGAISSTTELLSAHILPWLQVTRPPNPNKDSLTPEVVMLAKTSLQLLGNVCVGHVLGQEVVWQLCFPEVFRSLTSCSYSDVVDLSSMVIHMCTHNIPEHRKQLCSCNVIAIILGYLATDDHLEWTIILLDSLLTTLPLRSIYESLDNQTYSRLDLLEFAFTRLDSDTTGNEIDQSKHSDESSHVKLILSEENLVFLGENLHSHTHFLLRHDFSHLTYPDVATNLHNPLHARVKETMATIRLLCQFTQHEWWLLAIQRHCSFTALLTSCIALLNHIATSDGSDTSGKHRSRLQSVSPSGEEKEHLLFGFKKTLIQLIANLCYQSRHAQDKVRELEAIPLILNQCSVDHFNPYIAQWAVFAIRNLCEGNQANQELIAGLEKTGMADTQALLEFGCEVEVGEDGKIRVKTQSNMPVQQ